MLRRLLGRLVHAPCFPYTQEMHWGSQRCPWPPHRPQGMWACILRVPDIFGGKKTLFIKAVRSVFSFKPLRRFHFSLKHLGGKVIDQNHCFLFSYSASAHVENSH